MIKPLQKKKVKRIVRPQQLKIKIKKILNKIQTFHNSNNSNKNNK